MTRYNILNRMAVLLFVATLGFLMAGCKGPEVASKSDRPWNSPRSWEHGLPSGLNEGR